jgi:hypothetical protein
MEPPNRQIIDYRHQPSGEQEHESHAVSNGTAQNDSGWGHSSVWHPDLDNDENNERDRKGDKEADDLQCRPRVGRASH